MGKWGIAGIWVAMIVSAAFASSAMAGEIVYIHGGDLWAMNDNGTDQHVLLTARQVGGPIGQPDLGQGYSGLSVQPNGTAVVFDANVAVPGCTGYCSTVPDPGLYTLIGGVVKRLSAPLSTCGDSAAQCEAADVDPAVTTSGRVVYVHESAVVCGQGCATTSSEILSRAMNGSDSPARWPLPSSEPPEGAGGIIQGTLASDPVDPARIAYSGGFVLGLPFGQACGTDRETDCYPIDIADSDGKLVAQPSVDDTLGYAGLSFSQNGSLIADLESGNNPGVWVYPTGQNYSQKSPAPRFTWAVASGTGTQAITGPAFVGNDELVFSVDHNLYRIPASCWATPANTSDPAPNCDTATSLTTNGTASDPNTAPVWTSSTTPIKALGPAVKLRVSVTASASQNVIKQGGLKATIECNLTCGIAAAGGVVIKGGKTYYTKTVSGALAANRPKTELLRLPATALTAIAKALKNHKQIAAEVAAIAETSNQKAKGTAAFRVTK
jgi:hypothetical protein